MSVFFISDLHLSAERPHTSKLFVDFLHQSQAQADKLYILGDLFDAWIGDDYREPELDRLIDKLKSYIASVPTAFIHGNRDFLIAEEFSRRTGIELLPELQVIDLYGTQTLIMHGDTLCTDDVEYQKTREKIRHPDWIRHVLTLPLEQRLAMAKQFRDDSRNSKAIKAEYIMDVNQNTVEKCMLDAGVSLLIHGHTHRPNIHRFTLDGQAATRIVLGDWDTSGSYLECSTQGYELKVL